MLYNKQGEYGETLVMFEEASSICSRALGIDNQRSADVQAMMAIAKVASGDVVRGLDSARESVRIYTKVGVANERSQHAAKL